MLIAGVTKEVDNRCNPPRVSGVATGWTGVDMSTPVLSKTDFLVSPNSWRKHWGGDQPSLDPDVVYFSSKQNFKAKVNYFDKIVL